MTSAHPSPTRLLPWLPARRTGAVAVFVLALQGCSSGPAASNGPREAGADTSDAGIEVQEVFTETPLTLDLTLAVPTPSGDGGPVAAAKLTIVAHDGTSPVVTDLWLYTLDANQAMTPLTAFTSTASRKSPGRMLPATIAGSPSGLAPADDGSRNGLMTGTTRGRLNQGQFVSTVNGTVVVTLASVPTSPILVVGAVEDQRFAGAAVINPDGTPGTVPDGVAVPETHVRRSFARDVAPILHLHCDVCHIPTGPENAGFYLVTGTRDELVNDNFALKEDTLKCQTANPDGGAALATCIQNITDAEFLIEPGAPAVSDILERARPDENAGTSSTGLVWYGSKGQRYNVTYGDRRMPSTTYSTDAGDWKNAPTDFDMTPSAYQVLFDWVAQGAQP